MTLRKLTVLALALALMGAGPALAAYELRGPADGLSYAWDGTAADRFLPETPGQYQFDYGDNAKVAFTLPWSFPFGDTTYSQITATSDGSILLGGAGGPVIKAWNADLSSYFYGGVFVQHKTGPERVVVEWRTETFDAEGQAKMNYFEVVLNPHGVIRFDYHGFHPSATVDAGSGIDSNGDGLVDVPIADIPSMSQESFVAIDEPAGDNDGDNFTNFEEYLAATDPTAADSDGDGTPDGFDPDPLDPAVTGMSIALGINSLGVGQVQEVSLAINGLETPGDRVVVEQILDLDHDGMAAVYEPVVRRVVGRDGVNSSFFGDIGDHDGLADGNMATHLNFFDPFAPYHSAGDYVVKATSGGQQAATGLRIDPVYAGQSVSGLVTSGGVPVAGGLVRLVDKWNRVIASGFTDTLGQYELQVAEHGEEYRVIALAPDKVLPLNYIPQVALTSGQQLTGVDIIVEAGQHLVTGVLVDAQNLAEGIAGVRVIAQSSDYMAEAITDEAGTYTLNLPSGDFTLSVDPSYAQGAGGRGYIVEAGSEKQLNVSADIAGIDFALAPASLALSGSVLDSASMGLSGIEVQAEDAGGRQVSAVTDPGGSFVLPVTDASTWTVALADSAQVLGYIGEQFTFDPTVDPPIGHTLAATSTNALVSGTVTDSAANGVSGVPVTLKKTDGDEIKTQATAQDGTYELGAFSGSWSVRAATEEKGYLAAAEQSINLASGQSVTADFSAQENNLPDLIVASVTGPVAAQPGEQVTISATIKNTGAYMPAPGSYGAIWSRLYLSTDSHVTTSDQSLAYVIHSGELASGESKTASSTLTIPSGLAEGTYYLGCILDEFSVVGESNETNNSGAGDQIGIGDLVPRPDLSIVDISATLSENQLTITGTIQNPGQADAGAFETAIYVSTDTTISETDTLVGTHSTVSLAAGGQEPLGMTVALPATLQPGVYYIGAVTDGQGTIAESDETNNSLTGNQVNYEPQRADLVPIALSGALNGDLLDVSGIIENQGTLGADAFSVKIYLSSDAAITTADTFIGSYSFTSLESGGQQSFNTNFTLPDSSGAGTYYLGIIADDQNVIMELDENNNHLSGNQLTVIASELPDLIITGVTGPVAAQPGEQVTISATIKNTGAYMPAPGSYGAIWSRLYLSPDSHVTTSDQSLAYVIHSGELASGESKTASSTLTIPSGLAEGTYYLGCILDEFSVVGESDETNNSGAGDQILIGQ